MSAGDSRIALPPGDRLTSAPADWPGAAAAPSVMTNRSRQLFVLIRAPGRSSPDFLAPIVSTLLWLPRMTTISYGGAATGVTGAAGAASRATGLGRACGGARAAGRPGPYSSFSWRPGGVPRAWSPELRNTNWTRPSLPASVRISACSGVTSSVTTGTLTARPLESGWICWPAETTRMFCRIVLVRAPASPGGLTVTSTSTRRPGSRKPATPTTSFTLTATARMPVGITGDNPNPLPRSASRPATMGSSSRMLLMTGRPTTSSTFSKAPVGRRSRGTLTILTSAVLICTPTGKAVAATIRPVISTFRGLFERPAARALIW